jgi:protein-disulfide isomerase
MVYASGTGLSVPSVTSRDHIRGLNLRNVTLLEYADYECPYSRQANPIVESILKNLNNNIRFIYRHFPLTQIHPHAEAAAKAAEAAALQGQFWVMHEQLYKYQSLDYLSLRRYANIIGLNLARFDQDLASPAVYNRVREDYQSGLQSGVQGTPSFFINGKYYRGSWDFSSLFSAIKAEIKP